jgi:hypothetical protein
MTDKKSESDLPEVADEPGMAERFQRGLRRALNTPHQPRAKPEKKKDGAKRQNRSHSTKP